MKRKFKEFVKKHKRSIDNFSERRRLENKDFTIISNNCWGGRVYQDLDIPYQTPFIGLFLYAPCYLKLLQNLEYYMEQELTFTDHSIYERANRKRDEKYYPLGKLDDIELQMLHFKDEEEAVEKWERRKLRMNWDNIYVKISERDQCTEDILREFDKLDYENKVCFTAKDYEGIETSVYFSEFEERGIVENETNIYKRYFDAVDFLDKDTITRK